MNPCKIKSVFAVLFAITSILCLTNTACGKEPLIFAVHPYLPATDLIGRFTPFAEYLSTEVGQPVKIEISKTYEDHITLIGENRANVAYMGSASYVRMVSRYGRKPLLARMQVYGKPTFQGIIIVREDSDLLRLNDLIGRSFAFGDRHSTMSYLVPRYVLWKAGVDLEDLGHYEMLKNHTNVALAVLSGAFDAGAVKEEVFFGYSHRGLRELMRTPPVSEYLLVAGNSLPDRTVRKLREAMYSLVSRTDGQYIMTSIKPSMTGLVPVKDEDYDNLRHILQTIRKLDEKP